MQKHLRNLIIGIGCFVVFIFIVQLILVKMKGQPAFSYSQYQEKQESFNSCYGSKLKETQDRLHAFIEHSQSTENIKDLKTTIFDELPKTKCEVSFVTSNDEQLRNMAQEVLKTAQTYYGMKDIRILDTVYAVEESFAAYLQTPRPYLFFALTKDETHMVAITVIPQEKGYKIETLWEKEKAKDNAFVQKEVGKLLYLFDIKAF